MSSSIPSPLVLGPAPPPIPSPGVYTPPPIADSGHKIELEKWRRIARKLALQHELRTLWNQLKVCGGFSSNEQFIGHLLRLEVARQIQLQEFFEQEENHGVEERIEVNELSIDDKLCVQDLSQSHTNVDDKPEVEEEYITEASHCMALTESAKESNIQNSVGNTQNKEVVDRKDGKKNAVHVGIALMSFKNFNQKHNYFFILCLVVGDEVNNIFQVGFCDL